MKQSALTAYKAVGGVLRMLRNIVILLIGAILGMAIETILIVLANESD